MDFLILNWTGANAHTEATDANLQFPQRLFALEGMPVWRNTLYAAFPPPERLTPFKAWVIPGENAASAGKWSIT